VTTATPYCVTFVDMLRLRNDEVAEGGLNYQQQVPPWCGVERERGDEESEGGVLLGQLCQLPLLPQTDGLQSPPNKLFGFTTFQALTE
jgi:hypothetical protein